MRRSVLLYGLLCGVLIAVLQLVEYRWLVVDRRVEIYGGLVAAVFAAVRIWLGLRLVNAAVTLIEPLPVGLLFTLLSATLLDPLARRSKVS